MSIISYKDNTLIYRYLPDKKQPRPITDGSEDDDSDDDSNDDKTSHTSVKMNISTNTQVPSELVHSDNPGSVTEQKKVPSSQDGNNSDGVNRTGLNRLQDRSQDMDRDSEYPKLEGTTDGSRFPSDLTQGITEVKGATGHNNLAINVGTISAQPSVISSFKSNQEHHNTPLMPMSQVRHSETQIEDFKLLKHARTLLAPTVISDISDFNPLPQSHLMPVNQVRHSETQIEDVKILKHTQTLHAPAVISDINDFNPLPQSQPLGTLLPPTMFSNISDFNPLLQSQPLGDPSASMNSDDSDSFQSNARDESDSTDLPQTPSNRSAGTTPGVGGDNVTPSNGSAGNTPGVGGDIVTPSNGSAENTPVVGGDNVIPSNRSAENTPGVGGDNVTPSNISAGTTPVVGGDSVTPSNRSAGATPGVGGDSNNENTTVLKVAEALGDANVGVQQEQSRPNVGDGDNMQRNTRQPMSGLDLL